MSRHAAIAILSFIDDFFRDAVIFPDRDMTQISVSNLVGRQERRVDVSTGVPHLALPPRRQRRAFRLPPETSMLPLLSADLVEGVEDVAAVLSGVSLGTLQAAGSTMSSTWSRWSCFHCRVSPFRRSPESASDRA